MYTEQCEKSPVSPIIMSVSRFQQTWPSSVSWLSRAHLALALICLILQLASTCLSGAPVINLTVPFLFVTAGFTSVVVHSCVPSNQAAISVSVLHGVSSLAAFAALVAPILGVRSVATASRVLEVSGSEVVFVLLAFITLSGGILSLLICVLDWKFSNQVVDECNSWRNVIGGGHENLVNVGRMFGANNEKPPLHQMHHPMHQPTIPPVIHQYETLKLKTDNFSEC